MLDEKGPEHKRSFKIGVYFNDKKLGVGTAPSKKRSGRGGSKKDGAAEY